MFKRKYLVLIGLSVFIVAILLYLKFQSIRQPGQSQASPSPTPSPTPRFQKAEDLLLSELPFDSSEDLNGYLTAVDKIGVPSAEMVLQDCQAKPIIVKTTTRLGLALHNQGSQDITVTIDNQSYFIKVGNKVSIKDNLPATFAYQIKCEIGQLKSASTTVGVVHFLKVD